MEQILSSRMRLEGPASGSWTTQTTETDQYTTHTKLAGPAIVSPEPAAPTNSNLDLDPQMINTLANAIDALPNAAGVSRQPLGNGGNAAPMDNSEMLAQMLRLLQSMQANSAPPPLPSAVEEAQAASRSGAIPPLISDDAFSAFSGDETERPPDIYARANAFIAADENYPTGPAQLVPRRRPDVSITKPSYKLEYLTRAQRIGLEKLVFSMGHNSLPMQIAERLISGCFDGEDPHRLRRLRVAECIKVAQSWTFRVLFDTVSLVEFVTAMHLAAWVFCGFPMPDRLNEIDCYLICNWTTSLDNPPEARDYYLHWTAEELPSPHEQQLSTMLSRLIDSSRTSNMESWVTILSLGLAAAPARAYQGGSGYRRRTPPPLSGTSLR